MLRNLMEEKQLNFNAPLMSVRRFSSQATAAFDGKDGKKIQKSSPKRPSVPYYKSELKSGPIRDAGAVPFLWEQIPGRPKDGGESRFKPPVAPPKLPPGRVLDIKQQLSSAKSAEGEDPETPRAQGDNSVSTLHPDVSSSNGNAVSLESSKEDAKEEKNHELEDCDDAFSDALDALSPSESFFMNCSVSGLTALDGPDLKMYGRDQQDRDFMIDRFLPAAKAMASETPQYAPRNKSSARESTREVHRIRTQPPQFRPYVLPQHPQDEEGSDDEDDDYADAGNLLGKACGILPQFCLKRSFCLLNPVPGMKISRRMPSPIRRKPIVKRKDARHGSRSETDDEHSWEAVHKYKFARGLQPDGAQESGSKLTSESNQLTYWSGSQTPHESSPYRRSAGDVISLYRNEASQSPFHEGMGFLGIPKQGNNIKDGSHAYGKPHNSFQGIVSDHNSQRGSGSASPAIEKTPYVEYVHMVETPNSRSSSADTKEIMVPVCKEPEILVGSERLEGSAILEAHLGEAKQLSISKEMDWLQSRFAGIVDLEPPSSILERRAENKEEFQHKDGLDQDCSLPFSELLDNGSQVINGSQYLGSEDQGDFYSSPMQSPLPPPLPKSPSESWLCRALPLVLSLNTSSRSYLGIQFQSRKPALKQPTTTPKWETIVKTSNVLHGHVRILEELKTPISQQSET